MTIKISTRVDSMSESVTLKLNEKANMLSQQGQKIFNLTAGQLPFRPLPQLVNLIQRQLSFLKSYQYSPVLGLSELRSKLLKWMLERRKIDPQGLDYDLFISNGAKHSLYNLLGLFVNPGDEVLLLAPYWISYPEMVKLWGGGFSVVESSSVRSYVPQVSDIEKSLTQDTKVLILNSPNNPAGIHYPESWMKEVAALLCKYPNLIIISDEIYSELNYYDPAPTQLYQHEPQLLERCFIVDGISKSLACTGLRIGYVAGRREMIKKMGRLQGQTTSGPNSLIQKALLEFDLNLIDEFTGPVKAHLRTNSEALKQVLDKNNLHTLWYQSNSAFYFLLDFSKTPYGQKKDLSSADRSTEICDEILQKIGVALVPGGDFGVWHTARMSLVPEQSYLVEAMEKLVPILNCSR